MRKLPIHTKAEDENLTTEFVFSYSINICSIIYLLDKIRLWMGEEGNGSWERDQPHSLFHGHFEKKGSKDNTEDPRMLFWRLWKSSREDVVLTSNRW